MNPVRNSAAVLVILLGAVANIPAAAHGQGGRSFSGHSSGFTSGHAARSTGHRFSGPHFSHRTIVARPSFHPGFRRPIIVAAPIVAAPVYYYPPPLYQYPPAYEPPPAYVYPPVAVAPPPSYPPQYVEPPQAVPQPAPPLQSSPLYYCPQAHAYTNDTRYMDCPEGWQQIAP